MGCHSVMGHGRVEGGNGSTTGRAAIAIFQWVGSVQVWTSKVAGWSVCARELVVGKDEKVAFRKGVLFMGSVGVRMRQTLWQK